MEDSRYTDQSQENITVARPLTGGRSTQNNRSSYDTPKPRPLSEEGLPSGMFLSGGRLTTFLDSDKDYHINML